MRRILSFGFPCALLLVAGCKQDSGGGDTEDGIQLGDGDGDGAGDGDGDGDGGPLLDVTGGDGDTECAGDEDCDEECEAPEHTPCDGSGDLATALGLNCPNEPQVAFNTWGNPGAMGVINAFGSSGALDAREGTEIAIIGSGFVADITSGPTDTCGADGFSLCCSRDLDEDFGSVYDPGLTLPAPIELTDVGPVTCADDPNLIGMGDCSNTLEAEFADTPGGAFDYTELRITTTVPEGVTSFSYDFAYFTIEWPAYWKTQFNDIFIGWLDSEAWTGNISFDEQGNAISVNAGFMDYLDSDTGNLDENNQPHPDCPTGANCTAPELAGTCMATHGGTKWLTTEAGVVPGEQMTLVLSVMDLGDSVLDSYTIIDNFLWGCEGEQPPNTTPIG